MSCQWRAATMTWELQGEGDLQEIIICESLEIFKKCLLNIIKVFISFFFLECNRQNQFKTMLNNASGLTLSTSP